MSECVDFVDRRTHLDTTRDRDRVNSLGGNVESNVE